MPAGDTNYTNVVASGAVVSDSALQLISGDGTIVLPSSPGVPKPIVLTKGSAAAITLPTPVAGAYGTGDDGKILYIYSETAFAHVVTCPVGFKRKGSSGTATATAAADNVFGIVARNGQWDVLFSTNFAFA
jgi:hypothetical protein